MTAILFMLASYGLVFGIQQKIPWPGRWYTSETKIACVFQGWMECPFCLGLWTGLGTGVAYWFTLGCPVLKGGMVGMVLATVAWSLSSAVLCLLMDLVLERLEANR